jgi:hypothetical protein
MLSLRRLTRRRALVLAAVAVAVVVVVLILALGGGDESTPYGEVVPSESGPAYTERPIYAFGQVVRLKTSQTTIEVRPVGFASLAPTAATGPALGVDLEIRNVGARPYRDQPMQAAAVTTRGGELDRLYQPVGDCRGVSADTVRMAPGELRRWCLPFARGGRPELFVYAPEAGLPTYKGTPEAAAWRFGSSPRGRR